MEKITDFVGSYRVVEAVVMFGLDISKVRYHVRYKVSVMAVSTLLMAFISLLP